jgi:hypothetical protein
MEVIATKIYEIVKDYRNDDGIFLTPKDILLWAEQFGEDAEFILTEIHHILSKMYISKSSAKNLLHNHIKNLLKEYHYTHHSQFLMDTSFLDVQASHKSQKAILNLLDEVLLEQFGESYKTYLSYPKRNFIYFDDLLATGGTVGKDLITWLNTNNSEGVSNATNVENGNYKLSINLFGVHVWGKELQKYRLKKEFNDIISKNIKWFWDIEIQNHLKFDKQALNLAVPTEEQPRNIKSYLAALTAQKYEEYAYRKLNVPLHEVLFTTASNRVKYENILLQKGLEIINMIKGEIKPNLRPLGLINPNYKTYGLGTHFFTWRNIPNNSPLVFWWQVHGHNWKPLFPVANRGN